MQEEEVGQGRGGNHVLVLFCSMRALHLWGAEESQPFFPLPLGPDAFIPPVMKEEVA